MPKLYINPSIAGISGDMLLGGLANLVEFDKLSKALSKLCELKLIQTTKQNINAVQLRIKHKNLHYETFAQLHEKLNMHTSILSPIALNFCRNILSTLEQAELAVHGKIHKLHELGSIDTIIDIIGVAYCFDILQVFGNIYSEPVAVGKTSAHYGAAVKTMLSNLPHIHKNIEHELTTPTGAAILLNCAKFGSQFSVLSSQKTENRKMQNAKCKMQTKNPKPKTENCKQKIVYSAGNADFDFPNVLSLAYEE